MNKKIIVMYHRADFDGIFCREIARKFKGDKADYIGWDYGQPLIPFPQEGLVYILDLSPECLDKTAWGQSLEHWKRIIWIDHHKSAIDKFDTNTNGLKIAGYRIDGVSACRLAWQWFCYESQGMLNGDFALPDKQHFIDRQVSEPYAVQLAGEYDIWDKRDPNAELFQHGLTGAERDFPALLTDGPKNAYVDQILEEGRIIQYSKVQENKGVALAFSFTVHFEGFCLLACNAARYNSQLFAAAIKPEHDGCLGFNWDGQSKMWRVSLYSDKPNIDLSMVAVKYGGGGHRGACGFRCKTLPFEL